MTQTESLGGRALRGVFYVGGAIATVAGLVTVITGAGTLPGQEVSNPTVESELRFYAAFYVAYGLALLRFVAPRADRDGTAVRAAAGALFLAGLARVVGWLDVGRPDGTQLVLLAIELVAPPVLVVWQAMLGSRGDAH